MTVEELIRRYAAGERDFAGSDLRGADLSEADLRGIDLSRANLREADLSGADLSDVSLYRADLSGAKLCGTRLRGADLRAAKLGGSGPAKPVGFGGASFANAQLIYAVLKGAALPADLRHD